MWPNSQMFIYILKNTKIFFVCFVGTIPSAARDYSGFALRKLSERAEEDHIGC